MGQTHTYVKGKGSHREVPPPLKAKVDFYRTTRKILTAVTTPDNPTIHFSQQYFDFRGKKKIQGDILPVKI